VASSIFVERQANKMINDQNKSEIEK
jgi:hypothetical protein